MLVPKKVWEMATTSPHTTSFEDYQIQCHIEMGSAFHNTASAAGMHSSRALAAQAAAEIQMFSSSASTQRGLNEYADDRVIDTRIALTDNFYRRALALNAEGNRAFDISREAEAKAADFDRIAIGRRATFVPVDPFARPN